MQIAAVHRVRDIVDRVTIIAGPRCRHEEAFVVVAFQFVGQLEFIRLGLLEAREIREDRVAGLAHDKARGRLAAFERTFRHGRHLNDAAVAVERDAVVAAGDLCAEHFAARETRATVRAVIFQAVNAIRAAPQNQTPA